MDNVTLLSLNCHGFSAGTVAYLKRVSVGVDVIMLRETWLSDITCTRINESLQCLTAQQWSSNYHLVLDVDVRLAVLLC